jgi:flavorubredoxin
LAVSKGDLVSLLRQYSSSPLPRQRPLEVAAGTFVIRGITPSLGETWTNLNSAVILAAEPIIVDTGMVTHRDAWFEDLFSLLRPEEVRWIYVTHTDSDHAGNLVEALERCPNAKVIISRGESYRAAAALDLPADRIRVLENWESFEVGDRTLRSIRPPVYDSPYTRGLFDHSTGVYCASDAFCAPMPHGPIDRVDEMPEQLWAEGMVEFHYRSLCPWVAMVDPGLFQSEINKLAELGINVIVGAHCPVIGKASVNRAFELMAGLPSSAPASLESALYSRGRE